MNQDQNTRTRPTTGMTHNEAENEDQPQLPKQHHHTRIEDQDKGGDSPQDQTKTQTRPGTGPYDEDMHDKATGIRQGRRNDWGCAMTMRRTRTMSPTTSRMSMVPNFETTTAMRMRQNPHLWAAYQ